MKLSLCLVALFLWTFVSYSLSQEQIMPAAAIPPPEVTAYSANRTSRLHHNLFHNIRMNWALLDAIEQRQIENLGWKPLFHSFAYVNNDINQPVMLMGPTGEDFLWMHHQMINEVNAKAESIIPAISWRVDGWYDCPSPSDTEWPVPPVPTSIVDNIPSYAEYLAYYKTDDFYNHDILPREQQMNDTTFLRSLTLGEFGTLIEYELHTYFHVRFSAYNPVGYRMQSLHPTAYIDPMWDNPEYHYLADFYSAHVNPTFWKIHGWIERKIEHWATAHSIIYTKPSDLPYTSTWEMGPMDPAILTALEQVARDAEARANDNGDNNVGEIVGSVIGGIVCMILILVLGHYLMKRMLAQNTSKVRPTHLGDAIPLRQEITDNT